MTDAAVVVIGGGATGAGVARDLALRGVDAVLVERGPLTGGTTGRSHGLLHSGARYADTDPDGARGCVRESRVLRETAGACVADTGGYVVQLSGDDDAYFETKREACEDCGIPVETVTGDALRDAEPCVSDDAERALRVPDGVVHPSRLVAATAADARQHGARIRTHTPVRNVLVEGGQVTGVLVGDGERIDAAHVVNAAGPWAGGIADLAGVTVRMRPTRGVTCVVGLDGVGSVLNRCRPPSDGDIAVPRGDSVALGTTSVAVGDPDVFERDDAEIARVVAEGQALLPAVSRERVRRSYWGVRPLYAPDENRDSRGISRDYAVLDHADRDGVTGLTTVVGGKLTTYRRMAESVADQVCDALGVPGSSTTADRPLLDADDPEKLDRLVAEFGGPQPADEGVVGDG
jgi:glycerol-3-phosphate dehydrogenase